MVFLLLTILRTLNCCVVSLIYILKQCGLMVLSILEFKYLKCGGFVELLYSKILEAVQKKT